MISNLNITTFKSAMKVGLAYGLMIYAALHLSSLLNGALVLNKQAPISAIIAGTLIWLAVIAGDCLSLYMNGQKDQINKEVAIQKVKMVAFVAAATLIGYTLGYQFIGKEYGGANMAVGFLFGLLQFAVLTSRKAKAAAEAE